MSGASALRRLTILHLRGAVERFVLDFEPKTRLAIVYGENGTGKSTICDAFDLLGRGTVGSLGNRGLGRTQEYWPSLGKHSGHIAVTLEATDGTTCHATVQRNDVVTKGAERPRVLILRRSEILALMQASDGDRYKAIQRFIDVSEIERSEDALLKAVKTINASLGEASTRIQEQRDSIREYWDAAGAPGSDALAWAEREAARPTADASDEIAALERGRAAFRRFAESAVARDAASRDRDEAVAAFDAARLAHDAAVRGAAAGADDVLTLLHAAREHFATHGAPVFCPLCESDARVAGLAAQVSERLAALASVQATHGALDARQSERERSTHICENAERAAESAARALDEVFVASWPSDVARPTSAVPAEAAAQPAWLAAHEALPEQWRVASAARERATAFATALRRAWDTYAASLAASAELGALLPRLQQAHDIVCEERRRFTDDLLAAIAVDVGRLYESVHPGEGLDKITLALDAKRRASLAMISSFLGTDGVPPAAYFSESHLDTLGLCVFLALAGRESPEETILVLDDPIASVDAPHAERAVEMLYAEASRFRHCVVTTHFKPWREKYRWGRLRAGECQFLELAPWSAASGLSARGTVPELDRLRRLLADSDPDPQLVAAKSGVVLEAALDFLTVTYRCAVPRTHDDRYTLGELLPAVNGKLRAALTVELRDGAGRVDDLHAAHAVDASRRAVTDRRRPQRNGLPLQRPRRGVARRRRDRVRPARARVHGAADR